MKRATFILAAMALACSTQAQTQAKPEFDQRTSKAFLQQLAADGVYNFVSQTVAESMLVHRVEPVMPHGDYVARISATVVVAFEITKEGNVRHAMVVSGPKMLQATTLSAVRQWKFTPCRLNGTAIPVATSFLIPLSNW